MRRQGEGGGSKNAKIEATSFMDGPLSLALVLLRVHLVSFPLGSFGFLLSPLGTFGCLSVPHRFL